VCVCVCGWEGLLLSSFVIVVAVVVALLLAATVLSCSCVVLVALTAAKKFVDFYARQTEAETAPPPSKAPPPPNPASRSLCSMCVCVCVCVPFSNFVHNGLLSFPLPCAMCAMGPGIYCIGRYYEPITNALKMAATVQFLRNQIICMYVHRLNCTKSRLFLYPLLEQTSPIIHLTCSQGSSTTIECSN